VPALKTGSHSANKFYSSHAQELFYGDLQRGQLSILPARFTRQAYGGLIAALTSRRNRQ
jgi:hypothetical protein